MFSFFNRQQQPINTAANYTAANYTAAAQSTACPPSRNYPIDFPEEQLKICEKPYEDEKTRILRQQKMKRVDVMLSGKQMQIDPKVAKVILDIAVILTRGDAFPNFVSKFWITNGNQNENFAITMNQQQRDFFITLFSLNDVEDLDYMLSKNPSLEQQVKNDIDKKLYNSLKSIVKNISSYKKKEIIDYLTPKLQQKSANSANYYNQGVGQNYAGQYVDERTGQVLKTQGGRMYFSRKVRKGTKKSARRKRARQTKTKTKTKTQYKKRRSMRRM